MKPELLEILRCPCCFSQLALSVFANDEREGDAERRFATGFASQFGRQRVDSPRRDFIQRKADRNIGAPLAATSGCAHREIRHGRLTCERRHAFDIEDGIIRFATGFDHDAVQRELDYENSTYNGSDRLRDEKLIAQFPETLAELWPHTCHFGPDFKALIALVNPKPGAWILDIGTGPCWSSRLLAQRGANVIALDVNEASFYGLKTSDILFEHHDVYFERILESMTNLPFENESLDAITFNASFHHTPDHEQTLRECQRVLKPNGVIAMVNEEFVSLRHRLFPPGEASDTGSHHAIAYSEFERALKRNGFWAEYFVAEHVRQKLNAKLSPTFGKIAVASLEIFPVLLQQLNSALVLLRKTHRVQSKSQTTENPVPVS